MKCLKGCLAVVGGFVVLIVGVALFLPSDDNETSSGGTNNSDTPTVESAQQDNGSQNSSPSTATIPLGIMSDIRNDRAIQIEGSEVVESLVPGNQFMSPVEAKGGKLVVVYMTLKNTGQESGNLFWTTFQLIDDQDRKYDEIQDFEELVSVNDWLDSQGLESGDSQLFPGGTTQTAKVFRVAPDANNLGLLVSGQVFAIQ